MLKKKLYGGKSQKYNGFKKVKKILVSFTKLWFNREIIIVSSNCTITRGKLFKPNNKSRGISLTTYKSFSRRPLLANM